MKDFDLDRLPIFRSTEQVKLLSEIFVVAPEPLTLSELARRTGVSPSGVHKEVTRLERAGLVSSQRLGRARLVSANTESPFFEDLRRLLLKGFGPAPLLRRALSDVAGIDEAFIYGSWATSETTRLERAPRDVDVMILGQPDSDRLHEAVEAVEAQVGREINITIFTRWEWEADDTGFAQTVRSGPRIDLIA